ncbi:hypothetical protein N9N67_09490 [Bacteriovoracaceae bacterium]|nr:hypothetical protein [Bacteriovoracaceae bacterium]
MMEKDGSWLSIMEYSQERNKSISTIRRYLKANRIKHKEVNGKYFIWCNRQFRVKSKEDKILGMSGHIKFLEQQIKNLKLDKQNLKMEIDELKMLVDTYEKTSVSVKPSIPLNNNEIPPIPS